MQPRTHKPSPFDPDTEIVGDVSEDALRAQWTAFHAEHYIVETPPPGAITASAYATINGTTETTAFQALKRHQQKGALQTGMFRIAAKDGTIRPTRHWWVPTAQPCTPKPLNRTSRTRG